jgi:hypothetical protein
MKKSKGQIASQPSIGKPIFSATGGNPTLLKTTPGRQAGELGNRADVLGSD